METIKIIMKGLIIVGLSVLTLSLITLGIEHDDEIKVCMGACVGLLVYLKGVKWAEDEKDEKDGINSGLED